MSRTTVWPPSPPMRGLGLAACSLGCHFLAVHHILLVRSRRPRPCRANDGWSTSNATRAASLDNRTFEVLAQWNVPFVAAPRG